MVTEYVYMSDEVFIFFVAKGRNKRLHTLFNKEICIINAGIFPLILKD